MLTGSVAPLGKSRSSASRPCLATVPSGSDDVPPSPMRRPSTGEASASSTAVVAIRLIAGRRMTARTARRQTGPSSPADAAIRRPSHGTRRRSMRSPRTISSAGWKVSATRTDTTPTITAPRPRLRSVVSGTSSIAIIASANAVPLKTTARVAVLATVRIASRVAAAAVALLAQPRDDEQRVVDAQREPHRDDHVHDEQVELERLPDDRGDGERDDDRDDRHQHRDRHAEERADHQQQHDQRRRQPELQLALAQVARGELLEVTIERVVARDVRRESRAAVRALHRRDQAGDPLVLRLGEDDRQHGGVAVGRARGPCRPGPGSWRSAAPRRCGGLPPRSARTRASKAASDTTRPSDRTTMTSSTASWSGSRASMSSCAATDSG